MPWGGNCGSNLGVDRKETQKKVRIPNVLADRYASAEMRAIWSAEGRVVLERQFWVAVLRGQKELGLEVADGALEAYESCLNEVDLDSIRRREALTRHDVKARIEEFCDLAGYQEIHKGLTSRDLTENVEQLQVYRSLEVIRRKAVAALLLLASRADGAKGLLLTARTHNVAAQLTTLGKRLAMFGEELLHALESLDQFISTYAVRGLKGAVGTQLDQLTLFRGDAAKVLQLEDLVLRHLGIPRVLAVVGQVYPRRLDFDTVSHLYSLASAPAGFAKTLRLMAGHELGSEGFAPGQVGSSAMPHKMNSRSCERINGFHTILRGYLTMAEGLAGDQWNEGDVSCSVVRRVCLPDSFFAIDGLLETFLTVLLQMEFNPAVIERESRHYLPFLLTTTILMEAVRKGVGREEAHEVIKEHAVAVAREWRRGEIERNDLLERLAADSRLRLTRGDIDRIREDAWRSSGAADSQVDQFVRACLVWRERFPEAAAYKPAPIL